MEQRWMIQHIGVSSGYPVSSHTKDEPHKWYVTPSNHNINNPSNHNIMRIDINI